MYTQGSEKGLVLTRLSHYLKQVWITFLIKNSATFCGVMRILSITKPKPDTMTTTDTIYKGVPLTLGRTSEMIDTIIELRDSMTTNELAEVVGFNSYRPLVGIFRHLNREAGTTKPKPTKKFKPIKTAKNTFKNYYGSGKDKARQLIADSIKQTKRQSSNILTLPADKWKMEKNILKQKPGYKFTAVERDKDTYKEMMKTLTDNDNLLDSVIGTANKSIGEVIVNDGEDTYSSAILDYCGFIDTFYNEINDVMKRNLVKKGGYIVITLSENDRVIGHPRHVNSHTNKYIRNCYANEEVTGAKVTNDLVNILVHTNSGYEIVQRFPYKDTKVKMQLFIIKRIDE